MAEAWCGRQGWAAVPVPAGRRDCRNGSPRHPGAAAPTKACRRAATGRRPSARRRASHRSGWTVAVVRTRWGIRPRGAMTPVPDRRSPAGSRRRRTARLGRPTWPRPAVGRRTAPRTSYAPPPSPSAVPGSTRPWPSARRERDGDHRSPPWLAEPRWQPCPTVPGVADGRNPGVHPKRSWAAPQTRTERYRPGRDRDDEDGGAQRNSD